VDAVPAKLREFFVVSQDITAEEHVRMQAAMQAFVDNSLSKTINFNAGATVDDVATAYRLAWKLGCKGITVYVTGSRETVVLETHATAEKKKSGNGAEPAEFGVAQHDADSDESLQMKIWSEVRKPRPRALPGYTFSTETPLGKAFITINENGGSQPFEIFINSAKAGSETAAVSEALGRLISFVLRLSSPVAPNDRLKEVVKQLAGIGGGRSLGFGPNRIRSMPDGLAHVLEEYLVEREERLIEGQPASAHAEMHEITVPVQVEQPLLKIGDLCPECGEAAVINEEGCRKCYACGYSEC
jgi:ribonucleoside-diphosphate reductase alpha chain